LTLKRQISEKSNFWKHLEKLTVFAYLFYFISKSLTSKPWITNQDPGFKTQKQKP